MNNKYSKLHPFTIEVINIIKSIPEGKVATYGQIARLAGNARSARQVVRILQTLSENYNLPWFRIINSKGQIAIKDPYGFDKQVSLLLFEGIEVSKKGKVDLGKYQWKPKIEQI